jgi:hypothetical protein
MSGMLKALQWVIDLLAWGGHRAKYASTARGPAGRAPLYRHGSRRGSPRHGRRRRGHGSVERGGARSASPVPITERAFDDPGGWER